MASLKFVLLGGVAGALMAGSALAQQADEAPPPPAQTDQTQTEQQAPADAAQSDAQQDQEPDAATVEEVVVTGRATDVRTSIDSTSYSLADDLQAANGTLADALRNIPSVEVDPDGNVSLRGDANVTILVDGRPAALFDGSSRSQLLLQIPASQYARIEVMTNPSAAYRPDGSGGVINLISKPSAPRPGTVMTGSVRANVGDNGRYNIGGNIAYSRDGTTLTGDAGFRHDAFVSTTDRVRERFGEGAPLRARQTQVADGAADSAYVRLAAEQRLDDKTQLNLEARYTDVDTAANAIDLYEADGPGGDIASAYSRHAVGGFSGQFAGATARVLRRFDDQGHEWSNEIRLDRAQSGYEHTAVADDLIPIAAAEYEAVSFINDTNQLGVTSAYTRPMENGAKLRAGYELNAVALELQNRVMRGAAPDALAVDPSVSNTFRVDQAVHALYATYERPFGEKLSAQFGLRLEQANLDLNQVTTGITASNDYFRAYPTLHLSYQATDKDTLRASYSRRIQRPQPTDLNPFLSYQDPLSYRAGNPDLLPQETDSFEATWQRRSGQNFYQATLYLRDTTDAFTQVLSELGGDVLLTRPENLGSSRVTGLELAANGGLHRTLRYNASVNMFRQEIDAAGIPGAVDREGETISGRLTLNWQPTQADFLQVSSIWTGDQQLAQGVRESSTLVNLGYRRKLNDAWSVSLTVRDALDSFGDTSEIRTMEFSDRTERVFGGRAAFIGLTWNFGQGPRRQEPAFDFSGAPAGG